MFASTSSRLSVSAVLTVLLLSGSFSRAEDERTIARKTPGLYVVLGDPEFALDLARSTSATVFVQSPNTTAVENLRMAADAAGVLGKRLWVQQGDESHLNLANDLADAVFVTKGAPPERELLRVLRPAGKAIVADKVLVKPQPTGVDDWTHPYHGPDNNPQSNDRVARRPYLTHFMAEPWYCPLSQMTVASGGRLFKVFGDRSSAKPQEALINKMIAMSAFNGTILWQRDLTPGFMIHRNTFIASPDTLYLADDKSCQLIDPETGKVRSEIVVPAQLSDGPVWKWLALDAGILYALVGEKEGSDQPLKTDRIRGAGWPWWGIKNYNFGFGRTFLAIDPRTRKVLWHHREEDRIDSRAVCMKNGRIYYYSDQKFLACLDTKSGKPAWINKDKDLLEAIGPHGAAQHWMLGFASTAYVKAGDDALYFAGPQRPRLVAASTKDGKLLWQQPAGNVQLVLRSEGLYALGEGSVNSVKSSRKLEPLTGKLLAEFPSRDRCTRATGCVDSIFTRGGAGGSTAVFDTTSKDPKMGVVALMRPACTDGVLTANGYLYWGPWMCRCDMTQLGVISLGPAGSFDFTAEAKEKTHLESSMGDTKVPSLPLNSDDWPTYRKDNARTGVTTHTTPAQVKQRWEFKPAGTVMATAPITAGNLVLSSGTDGAVRALDADSGKSLWTAYTGGPLKYPPVVANDRVYAGSGDGWVYCFEAKSGRQLWRFRAAPIERTIPVYGSLSSTWPISSGALVEDGVVYAAAGISNFDGTHVYALDALTGKIRWQNHASGHTGGDMPGNSVSVQGPLLLHNKSIYLAGGNRPTVASYAVADGKFTVAGGGRGKDLFVRRGQVQASGFPLHWRPEDDHFLSPMELETPAGTLAVNTNSVALLAKANPGQKPTAAWTSRPFQEIAAVAVTKNAVLVTGLDRDRKDSDKTEAGLTALSLDDGKVIWKQELTGKPVAWGLALDRAGRMMVTMQDGRVVCVARE